MDTERTNLDPDRDIDTADLRDRDVNPDPITGEPGAIQSEPALEQRLAAP